MYRLRNSSSRGATWRKRNKTSFGLLKIPTAKIKNALTFKAKRLGVLTETSGRFLLDAFVSEIRYGIGIKKDTYLIAIGSIILQLQDKYLPIDSCYSYSSGANIGSQEGSMIGFCSMSFIMSAGTYFFSTTTRNM